MLHKLSIVFILLVVILLIKQFLESGYFRIIQNTIHESQIKDSKEQAKFQQELNKLISNTQRKINKATEDGYIEAFSNTHSDNNSDNQNNFLPSYLNKTNAVKIQLFYKPGCKYCKDFMPTWTQIINNLPNGATYEEINCDVDLKSANENKITSVPTIILLVDNEKHIYMGNRTYNDIDRFFRTYGVNLIQRKFEDFASDGYSNDPEATKIAQNPNCPAVSFDKQIDLENDSYMYQIFNSDGQYGYAVGGYNSDKTLNPFMAAYSTVDSYLSSLPDRDDPTKNSYKNINECAGLYANNIVNFGLCDVEKLDNILAYQKKITSGEKAFRVDNTDYSTNTNVVNAIKKVCGFTN
jgi:thiol-disulfide isomerase/thioredoxin